MLELRIAGAVPAAHRARVAMLLPVFQDLIRPQWRRVLEELKRSGGMAVTELAASLGAGYVTVKAHCEELVAAGYVVRTRLPRVEVGRPQVFYSLAAKADALFPEAGVGLVLEMLDELKPMFGVNAPERLLYQHFQNRFAIWAEVLDKVAGLEPKVRRLATLRSREGITCECRCEEGGVIRLLEHHHPLARVFERYPRAVLMELRMIEQLLGARVARDEQPGGREGTMRVVFTIG